MPKHPLALLFALGLGALLQSADAGTATVYRDTWGTPYIYGENDADAAYGLGYAQAEDRLDDIYLNVRQAVGLMSEVLGKEYVESDYVMQMVGNAKRCEAFWPSASEPVRAMAAGYFAGVEAYLADHPDRKSPYALELKPWHSLAIMRAMILNWPLGTVRDEMNQEGNTLGWGSNEWSVSPKRSAEGCPILMTDPHLTWSGMSVFYEANVYGTTLTEQHGYFLVGTFLLAYGHTEHFGWAPTTGGPDTADVYAMKLNPANPLQYEYDGKWLDAEMGSVTINVKDGEPVTLPTYTTILGPAFAEPNIEKQTILVGATPYLEQTLLLEQGYKCLLSKNVDELLEGLAMNQYMEQNLMSADRDGNIAYVRTGRVPIRPEGYNWSAPVPGNTSKTKWLGIHDAKDLVQIKNPKQGYMQNCNISPEFMMENSPLTPDKYPNYIYNVSWDSRNSRGDRALQALAADDSVTKEEAMELGFDVTDPYREGWKQTLKKMAIGSAKKALEDPAFKADFERLQNWDGRFVKESNAAPLMRYFRMEAFEVADPLKINAGKELSVEEYFNLKKAFDKARETMIKLYGKTDITWGDMVEVGRGDTFVPTSGADFGRGENDKSLRTLLSLGVHETPEGSGKFRAYKGSMAMLLMFMHKDGIESYSCIPWGQSADPASPHFMDQGEKLFSNRKFKPVYRSKEELLKHVESEKSLKTAL